VNETWLESLSFDECLDRLDERQVGRLALVSGEFPLIFPVNYRLVRLPGKRHWIAFRTRPGNVIERATIHAAFEIDDVDQERREGWSVLVRGTLHHVDPDAADFRARFAPDTWVVRERDTWMVIEAFQITGRRLRVPGEDWSFDLPTEV
jgi:nitroimidazol reductase NimA-like FMN-containing flavoprotein (pyridoxamine 5'-phosphate oxidase superfamily)